MSVQAARDFLKHIKTDTSLQDRLKATPDLKARQQIIKEAGFDFTVAGYKQVMEELALAAGQELTTEEMQQVSGGLGFPYRSSCPNLNAPQPFPIKNGEMPWPKSSFEYAVKGI